jgi:hypothetical protein
MSDPYVKLFTATGFHLDDLIRDLPPPLIPCKSIDQPAVLHPSWMSEDVQKAPMAISYRKEAEA